MIGKFSNIHLVLMYYFNVSEFFFHNGRTCSENCPRNLCDQMCKFIFMRIFLAVEILPHDTGSHEGGVNERDGEGFLEEVTFELGIEA